MVTFVKTIPHSSERWEEWTFCQGRLGSFNAFVMLNTTFSKHSLIKISIRCVYIKPELLIQCNTTAMTEATNEVFIEGDYLKVSIW